MSKTNRYLVLVFVVIALTTGLFGYSGLWHSVTNQNTREITYDIMTIVDAVQIWHSHGLGSSSDEFIFTNVDFYRIGLSSTPNATEWKTHRGTYTIVNRTPEAFDILIIGRDGKRYSARNITGNALPDIVKN